MASNRSTVIEPYTDGSRYRGISVGTLQQ